MLKDEIVLLDLFSGIGGFARGFNEAGFKISTHYFSEIDKYAVANYKYNFPDAVNLGNIEKIKGKKIERPDVIAFGSPCQDISLAGKQKGLKGKRSHLFFEAVRLISEAKPRVFVFENVKALLFSNEGKDFETVLQEFANIGLYELQWQLLNTSWFLPQNRERLYIVGHLREESRPEIFPFVKSSAVSQTGGEARKVSENITTAITSNYHKGVHGRGETYIQTRISKRHTGRG
jgi:DNA (cytosine-5)-methyltransferase 1